MVRRKREDSITCKYESGRLYTVTLLFMPEETEREGVWAAMKKELFNLYDTVEGNVQTSILEKPNITTESEDYLWGTEWRRYADVYLKIQLKR